jgi:peptidoglycan/LPS O-acetylase OafA/YrhL
MQYVLCGARRLIGGVMTKWGNIGLALDRADGRPAGFDYLRLALASGVIISHADWVTRGDVGSDAYWLSPAGSAARLILPCFFALSGFLVAGSFERSRILS